MANAPVLVVAVGMTLVILARQIDISIGSQFAICGVVAGLLAKAGLPDAAGRGRACWRRARRWARSTACSSRAWVCRPSSSRWPRWSSCAKALRWATEGAWVQDLPERFQWFGLGQAGGRAVIVIAAIVVFAAFAWALRHLAAGRAVYAVGSDRGGRAPRRHPARARVVFACSS